MRKNLLKVITVYVLSVFVLLSFNFIPVSAEDNPTDKRTNHFGDKAELFQKDKINYTFDKLLNLKNDYSTDKDIVLLLDTSGNLNKTDPKTSNPFEFSLFSGSSDTGLLLQGQTIDITGKIHTNNVLTVKADSYRCTGASQYTVSADSHSARIILDTTFVQHEYIPMSSLYSELIDPALNSYMIYEFTPGVIDNTEDTKDDASKIIKRQFIMKSGSTVKVAGIEVTLNGTDQFVVNSMLSVPPETSFFFDGSLKANNSMDFQGKGLVCAFKDIDIYGAYLDTTGAQAFIYSDAGHIYNHAGQIGSSSDSWFNGIMYAPNSFIQLEATNVKVRGSIIAKTLNSLPQNTTIEYKMSDVEPIKEIIYTNTYLNHAIESANKIIQKYHSSGMNVYISVLKYDKDANDNDFNRYDVTDDTGLSDLEYIINNKIKDFGMNNNSGDSNLGDGLRRAYEILNKSPHKTASKFIIVLSGSKPNMWTEPDEASSPDKFKLDYDDAEKWGSGSSEQSNEYALEVGKIAVDKNILPIFVNFMPTDNYADVDEVFKNTIVPGIKGAAVSSDLIKDSVQLYYTPITKSTPTPTPAPSPVTPAPTPTSDPIDFAFVDDASSTIDSVNYEIHYTPISIDVKLALTVPAGVASEQYEIIDQIDKTDDSDWEPMASLDTTQKIYTYTANDIRFSKIDDSESLMRWYEIQDNMDCTFLAKYINIPGSKITKYNETVTFPNTDSVTYTIHYYDPVSGTVKTAPPITQYLNELKVNITNSIIG